MWVMQHIDAAWYISLGAEVSAASLLLFFEFMNIWRSLHLLSHVQPLSSSRGSSAPFLSTYVRCYLKKTTHNSYNLIPHLTFYQENTLALEFSLRLSRVMRNTFNKGFKVIWIQLEDLMLNWLFRATWQDLTLTCCAVHLHMTPHTMQYDSSCLLSHCVIINKEETGEYGVSEKTKMIRIIVNLVATSEVNFRSVLM